MEKANCKVRLVRWLRKIQKYHGERFCDGEEGRYLPDDNCSGCIDFDTCKKAELLERKLINGGWRYYPG